MYFNLKMHLSGCGKGCGLFATPPTMLLQISGEVSASCFYFLGPELATYISGCALSGVGRPTDLIQ